MPSAANSQKTTVMEGGNLCESKRDEIYYAELSSIVVSGQDGNRPVFITIKATNTAAPQS